MDREEFYNEIKNKISEYISGELKALGSFKIEEIKKNNDNVLHGLLMELKGDGATPIIYLEPYFEAYEMGVGMKKILQTIGNEYEKALLQRPQINIEDMNFDKISNNIFLKL